MKPSLISSLSSLFAISYLLLPTSQATPSLNLTNLTSDPATNLTSPPDHYQIRVYNTHTTLTFHKYGPRLDPFTLVSVVEKAQYEVCGSVRTAKGDGPVAQPTFEWRRGRTYVRMEQRSVGSLRWSVMSQALHGLLDFEWWLGFEFTVLTDEDGVVGGGSVGLGYS